MLNVNKNELSEAELEMVSGGCAVVIIVPPPVTNATNVIMKEDHQRPWYVNNQQIATFVI